MIALRCNIDAVRRDHPQCYSVSRNGESFSDAHWQTLKSVLNN